MLIHPSMFSAARLIYAENALGYKDDPDGEKTPPTSKGLNGNKNSNLSEMCGNEIRSAINNSLVLPKALNIAATGGENQVTQRYMRYSISETEHAGSNKGEIHVD